MSVRRHELDRHRISRTPWHNSVAYATRPRHPPRRAQGAMRIPENACTLSHLEKLDELLAPAE